jgi:Flp pilus assembly protein TadG
MNHRAAKLRRQHGTTTVEFAIVGLLVFIVLFGAIEMGRLLFTLNTLREVTYRGARMAAICSVDNPAIARIAVFNSAGQGTNSAILPSLTTDNILIEYLLRIRELGRGALWPDNDLYVTRWLNSIEFLTRHDGSDSGK